MTSSVPEDLPYRVVREREDHAVVRFGSIVDHARSAQHDEQLRKIATATEILACDFSDTEVVGSEWLRLVGDLAIEAKEQGRRVVVVGLAPDIRDGTVDALALKKHLEFLDSLKEAVGE